MLKVVPAAASYSGSFAVLLPRRIQLESLPLNVAAQAEKDQAVRQMAPRPPRVLSIQSHTVHGYVGNRCCVFPLQRLGLEVDFINSVQFSNHTGYPSFKGSVVDGKQLQELLEGLQANGLATHSHLITGYIGSVSLLRKVLDVVSALRSANPDLVYVCDPVMGDDGRLYVASELLECFRDEIVPAASILTPNQYEAELLVEFPVHSLQDALRACQALHDRGPHTVVITSFCPKGGSADELALIASTTVPQAQGRPAQFQIKIPKVDGYFTGTGDLMAALILAHTQRHPDDLATAVERTLSSTQSILRATVEAAGPAATATDRTAELETGLCMLAILACPVITASGGAGKFDLRPAFQLSAASAQLSVSCPDGQLVCLGQWQLAAGDS